MCYNIGVYIYINTYTFSCIISYVISVYTPSGTGKPFARTHETTEEWGCLTWVPLQIDCCCWIASPPEPESGFFALASVCQGPVEEIARNVFMNSFGLVQFLGGVFINAYKYSLCGIFLNLYSFRLVVSIYFNQYRNTRRCSQAQPQLTGSNSHRRRSGSACAPLSSHGLTGWIAATPRNPGEQTACTRRPSMYIKLQPKKWGETCWSIWPASFSSQK